jgi:hypothetical protein
MKKLLIIILSLTMALGASAQHGFYRSHVVVVGGAYGPYYSPYYYPFGFGYPYYPYPYYGYAPMPTRLDLKIENIQNDYKQRIWAVKHDKNLPGAERRRQVRQLKHDRDAAILDARKNYYHH